MPDFFFTFGQDHVLPPMNTPLKDHYVRITAHDAAEARARMIVEFGTKWAMQYDRKPEERFVPAGELVHLNSARVAALLAFNEVNKAGFAGILPGGMLVDRREHPTAIPVPANSMMGIPEPRCVWCLGLGYTVHAGMPKPGADECGDDNEPATTSKCKPCKGTGLWQDPDGQ